MKETLLQKAKSIKTHDFNHRPATKEETEVIVAFINGDVGWKQLTMVVEGIGGASSINYGRVSRIIKDGVKSGWVKINMKK